ncbi:hypothetical protein EU545_01155 [Candidatus Thorarchaeota archaeon]|nr:MAG: hypothetical protein EU545_01155 [Candidatus Thorarchaeota archaeon]
MNEVVYADIQSTWEAEIDAERLQDLQDLRLANLGEYLSSIRMKLTETPAEDEIQADLLTREILNAEFMLKDLLRVRKQKIVRAASEGRRPLGKMTLSEERLYDRLIRGFEGHDGFVEEILRGRSVSGTDDEDTDQSISDDVDGEDVDFVLVRFLKPVETQFVGMDEEVYGPFEPEEIALIPWDNARIWLRDGTVTRVAPQKIGDRD